PCSPSHLLAYPSLFRPHPCTRRHAPRDRAAPREAVRHACRGGRRAHRRPARTRRHRTRSMSKTYRLLNGDTLVVSVDMAEWETITFRARGFRRPDAATAAEVAAAIKKSGVITASVDKSGVVILQTRGRGGH